MPLPGGADTTVTRPAAASRAKSSPREMIPSRPAGAAEERTVSGRTSGPIALALGSAATFTVLPTMARGDFEVTIAGVWLTYRLAEAAGRTGYHARLGADQPAGRSWLDP